MGRGASDSHALASAPAAAAQGCGPSLPDWAPARPISPYSPATAAAWVPVALANMPREGAVAADTLERWQLAYRQVGLALCNAKDAGAHLDALCKTPGPPSRSIPSPTLHVQMAADARQLGIPASAIPALPAQPGADDVRTARARLEAIIASFLSAAL